VSGAAFGVFGGTFDPVHLGHTGIARAAASALGVDRIELVLSSRPPHRPGHEPAPVHHRFAMLALATQNEPLLVPSDREVRRPGLSYMIDTLRASRDPETGAGPILLMGADAFAEFLTWREPEAIAREFDIGVLTRAGSPAVIARDSLPGWLAERITPAPPGGATLPPSSGGGRIFTLPLPPFPVSSTEIRNRAARGESLSGLVSPAVARYIEMQRLYRS